MINKLEETIKNYVTPYVVYGSKEIITQIVPLHLFKNNQTYYLDCHWVIVPDKFLPNKNKVYIMNDEGILLYETIFKNVGD